METGEEIDKKELKVYENQFLVTVLYSTRMIARFYLLAVAGAICVRF